MYSGQHSQSRGFTLIEVLVVVGIIAVISAIAIPGLAKLGAFTRDEFKRTVSQVDSLLRAAEIYSTTYHVNAAVVYSMDHYSESEAAAVDTTPVINPFAEDPGDPANPITQPVVDSFTGAAVRQIEAAAVMYQLPSTSGGLSGLYVPIPGDLGEFQPLPPGMSIMLQNPEKPDGVDPLLYETFYWEGARSNYRSTATVNQIGSLGMNRVEVALGVPAGMDSTTYLNFANNPANYLREAFAAHVFRPSGRLSLPSDFGAPECGDCGRERFTLYIAPGADRPLDERLIDPESTDRFDVSGISNLRFRKIYVHKSTGRTSIPDAF